MTEADIKAIAHNLKTTYADGIGVNRQTADDPPRQSEVVELIDLLWQLIFPGYGARISAGETTEAILAASAQAVENLSERALRHQHGNDPDNRTQSENAAMALLDSLPDLREIIKLDIAAAYAGDPAAKNYEEIIFSYPGLLAITVQRLAHVLYLQDIPLLPRMMTEYAHSQTGIDINPGARLGKGIFIDHGTGVVIGETAELGDNVRIYQGVTLGAVNFPKDSGGILLKGHKRHPTIGCNVVIYSGASVLGNVTIGDNSIIGGNVWLTESLPAGSKITARPPEQIVRFVMEGLDE